MAYRWLLALYPSGFRRTYGDELEADFDEARGEAAAGGPSAIITLWLDVLADLAVSVPREWSRTPWLAVLAAAAVVASGIFYYVVGRVYRVRSFASATQPPESPELLMLMGLMVLIPVAVMIVLVALQFFGARSPRRRRV